MTFERLWNERGPKILWEMEVQLAGNLPEDSSHCCLFQAELQTTLSIWDGNSHVQIFSTRCPAGQTLQGGILGFWDKWENECTGVGKEAAAPQ